MSLDIVEKGEQCGWQKMVDPLCYPVGGVFLISYRLASSSASGVVRGGLAFADYLPIVFNGVYSAAVAVTINP